MHLTSMKRRLSDGPPAGNWSSRVLWKDPRTLDKEEHCVVPTLPGMAPGPSYSSFLLFLIDQIKLTASDSPADVAAADHKPSEKISQTCATGVE